MSGSVPEVADARRRRLPSGAWVVVGILITALVGPFLLTTFQNRRDHKLADQRALGATRMLFVNLMSVQEQLHVMQADGKVREFAPEFQISVSGDDLRLIAERLSPEDWGGVMVALERVPADKIYLRTLKEDGHKKLRFMDRCALQSDEVNVVGAAESLADLAQIPKGNAPSPELADQCLSFYKEHPGLVATASGQ